jgi:hypothetical protein
MSLSDLLAFPWQTWGANAASVARYFSQLVTIPLSLTAIAALLALPWLGRKAWLLGIWTVLPIVGQIAIAARFYERYILFSIPPVLILAARLLEWAYKWLSSWASIARRTVLKWPIARVLGIAVLILLLLPLVIQDFGLLTDLETANRATSGFYGLRGMRDYLAEQAKTTPIYVVVNYSPAPVEDGSAVLLRDVPGIKVLRVAPFDGKLTIFDPATKQVYPKEYFQGQEVYYANSQGAETNSWLAGHVELVQSFPNLRGDDSYVGLYRIRFDNTFR